MDKVETLHIVLCGCGLVVAALLVLIVISVMDIREHDEWIRNFNKKDNGNTTD